jgi:hypothetical protein
MSSNNLLLIREAQVHELGVHEGRGPNVRGCEKNLENVGLRSGQPEGPLLSGASCGGKEACSRFVVYVLIYTNRIQGENTRGKDEMCVK